MKNKFPKNIYQVWFQGKNNITQPKFIENMKNWEVLNPDWKYACLNNNDLRNACKEFSENCLNVYDSMSIMHMKIDLGRYVYIYLYGGIYVDMDMYIIRGLKFSNDLNNIIDLYENKNEHVIGLSCLYNLSKVEKMINGIYNNAMMICTPKNPVMKNFIEFILERCSKYNSGFLKEIDVNSTTGPKSFNTFFENKVLTSNLSKIVKISSEIFEPCDISGKCNITDNTVSIHQFELSWLSDTNKKITKIYFSYIRHFVPFIIILIISYIIFLLYKNKK